MIIRSRFPHLQKIYRSAYAGLVAGILLAGGVALAKRPGWPFKIALKTESSSVSLKIPQARWAGLEKSK